MGSFQSARHAGLLSFALAAIALCTGVWLAGATPPIVQPEQPASLPPEAAVPDTLEYADAWETKSVEIRDGIIAASPSNGEDRSYSAVSGLVESAEIYELPAQGSPGWGVPEHRSTHTRAETVAWLASEDMVYGVSLHGETRCYPQTILAHHCVLNSLIADEHVVIYYDPLSKVTAAFVRPASPPEDDSFRVVGYGYGGIALLNNTASDGFWDALGSSRFMPGAAVTGQSAKNGERLTWIPGEWMTFAAWTKLWPNTSVMSVAAIAGPDGKASEYTHETDPYTHVIGPDGQTINYYESDLMVVPEKLKEPGELPGKTEVFGVRLADGSGIAIPVAEAFDAAGDEETRFTKSMPQGKISLVADRASQRMKVTVTGNVVPPQTRVFWYAWHAHYPESIIWHVGNEDD